MAISRVEIKDFLVFKGDFAVDFCPGVNVIIGGNGTGKTTLLKGIEWWIKGGKHLHKWVEYQKNPQTKKIPPYVGIEHYFGNSIMNSTPKIVGDAENSIYIPEKDILEHAKGLLTFIAQKQTGFSKIYRDVLVSAQDIPTQKQSETQAKVGAMIVDKIGGTVRWDKGDGSFYTLRTDGTRIPFANEASGYKKLGFLGLLVTSGQLEKGSVLLWDEPENSINPELMPVLVEILLELQRGGVQIFLATHSEVLASYFAVLHKNDNDVMFYSLYKDGEQIKADKNDRFDLLTPNNLTAEQVNLYKKEIDGWFNNG